VRRVLALDRKVESATGISKRSTAQSGQCVSQDSIPGHLGYLARQLR
jgi:hypothetical protein